MKVTIFGSCRQQPLLEHYTGTSIQEELTYTHYTKEIIQAIEFCKGMPISALNTQYCFRTGILQNSPIINQADLQREYEESDVIVVEIASRICYEWNHLFMHHIATEEQYGFYAREQIVQRELTNEEIEADLWRIKQLVQHGTTPKKLLITSHIYTKEQGKRYDLIKLVERLCLKYDIAYLSPSEYLAHESEVYQEESILAHYTDKGKYLIGLVYKEHIENLFKTKTVVFVVKQQYFNYTQTPTSCFWGIGDMIRSIYGMYKKSKQFSFHLIIDISQHPISNFLLHSTHNYTTQMMSLLDTTPLIPNDNIDMHLHTMFTTSDVVYMGAHCGLDAYDVCEYDTIIKQMIKRHFIPNSEFTSYFNQLINNMPLSSMTIMHYRLGDSELVTNIIKPALLDKYYDHLFKYNVENSILLSDSYAFKSLALLRNCNAVIFHHEIGHIGYDTSLTKIKNSLFEFFISSKVKSIKTYSVYEWASGFVYSIHKLFDIPIDVVTCLDNYISKPNTIIISQPWGGLGDNLQFSTLPQLYSEKGYDVYISSDNAYRNTQIADITWKLNPYIKGVSDLPPNAGSCNGVYWINNEYIKSIEHAHGFREGLNKYPVIYYTPKKIDALANTVIYDMNATSNDYSDFFILSSFIKIFNQYPNCEKKKIIPTSLPNVRATPSFSTEFINVHNLFEYCDIIYSCKALICLHSGTAVLASAVKRDNLTPDIHSIHNQEKRDPEGFLFDNVTYYFL